MDTIPPAADLPTCSALSLQAGEALAGTASPTRVFVLLEYNGPWGAKAFEESDILPAVKDELSAQVKRLPQARLLLIRSAGQAAGPALRLYVAAIGTDTPALHAIELERYEDALDLDLARVLAGEAANRRTHPPSSLFLVCTNGRRDACCARYGPGVYQELQRSLQPELGEEAWQSTHIGGHRFAANLICLPAGLLYGRMRPADVAPLLQLHRQGVIDPEHYRGRFSYPEPAQAAEQWLLARGATHNRALLDVQETGPGRWRVCFTSSGGPEELEVRRETTGIETYESCPKGDPLQPGKLAFLERYRVAAWPG